MNGLSDRNPATQRAPAVSCYPSVRPRHWPNLIQKIRMAHYRKPLAAAAALNTAIFVVEAIAGFQADSLSLLMDSVHNLSDEMALVLLYLAFILPHGVSRHLLRSANLFNSVGLVLVSGLLLWQAVERMLHPAPVVGSVAIIVGLFAAAANWGVTICVGIGVAAETASAPATKRCSRSLSQLLIVVLPWSTRPGCF
jgi:Co/Zn/Cd efflux system component